MFGWLFGKKKKTETKVTQKVEVTGSRNRVVQTTTIVNQRGAKAKGDIVGGNKYSTYQSQTYIPYDPFTDPFSPLNPLSPMNTTNRSDPEPCATPSSSHDSGSSYRSHDSCSSSSYDSGSSYDSSSSYDSGSSYSSSSD